MSWGKEQDKNSLHKELKMILQFVYFISTSPEWSILINKTVLWHLEFPCFTIVFYYCSILLLQMNTLFTLTIPSSEQNE